MVGGAGVTVAILCGTVVAGIGGVAIGIAIARGIASGTVRGVARSIVRRVAI